MFLLAACEQVELAVLKVLVCLHEQGSNWQRQQKLVKCNGPCGV